jgi:hypothetical protein
MTVDLELCDRFVAFLEAFAHGGDCAKTATTVAAALDLPDTDQSRRELRACAQHAVKSGRLVCSGQRGYFVPATPGEVLAATSRLRSEASELWKRARLADQLAAERFDLVDEPEPLSERPALFALLEAVK